MKSKRMIILLLVLLPLISVAQDFDWAIQPQFEEISNFNEGIMLAKQNGKWGFVDKTWNWVIQPQFEFESVRNFYEGLAAIKQDGKWGFIDKTGKWIIEPRFKDIWNFNEGLAAVMQDDKWGFIDKTGNWVIQPVFEDGHLNYYFSEGMAIAIQNGKWGFIDKTGNWVINPQFKYVWGFSEGLASAQQMDKSGVIDKKGNWVINPQFDYVGSFSDGLAAAQQNGKSGVIDITGKWVINPQFEAVYGFSEGLGIAYQNEKGGFINKTGKWVINPQFEFVGLFSKGLAPAQQNGKWGFIDKTGNWVINPQFEQPVNFSDGLAAVKQNGKYGYIKLLTFPTFIKRYVEKEITEWQKKGEFEKTIDYQNRVTEATRNQMIQKYTDEAVNVYRKQFIARLNWNNLKLDKYDADNETYLIQSEQLGNFALPVPVSDAIQFKQNWGKMKFENPDFYVSNENMMLAKLDIVNPLGKKYHYDSQQPTTYSASNIVYNFKPLEVNVIPDNKTQNNTKIDNRTVVVGATDVDMNIPMNAQVNDKAFVVIIANENYQKEVKVKFAGNDGKVFKEYCEKTLGIPSKNIHFAQDASFGNMKSEIKWISDVASAFGGQAKIIFYYAGHGMPNEADKSAYLLPVDGFSSDFETAIKLEDLYTRLNVYPSKSITIFLDACFSGSVRDNGMLASARGVKIKPKTDIMKGNMVVFSAATGDETAYPYNDKQHGLFTYFLLKYLKETKGDANYADLSNFIIENVKQQSIIVNQKSQTPQVNTSMDIESSWQVMKLK